MAYDIKDVFYLSTSTTITGSTANGGSAQLDLSAYIDPIARGRTKGTGLAIYKIHYIVSQPGNGEPIDDAEAGTFRAAVVAGAGLGDVATGGINQTQSFMGQFSSLVAGMYEFYGPKSMIANASTPTTMYNGLMAPSTEVPYVVVRDNVCLLYDVGDQMTSATELTIRLEVAQVSLDQATLNQLLRTQTV